MQKVTITNSFIVLISGVFLLGATHARGGAVEVDWDSTTGFYTSQVTINPGDEVDIVNLDYTDDLLVYGASPESFSADVPPQNGVDVYYAYHIYRNPGTFSFRDQIYDTVTVTVNPPPSPPSVSITAPANNAVFSAPATFTVQATASANAGDYVTDVQFFLGDSSTTNQFDDVFSSPYTTGVTNLAAGTYRLIAVATEANGGLTATNAITLTVTASSAINAVSPRFAAGKFLFDVTGLTAGKTNIVFASANLASWTPVQTNIASATSITVTNTTTVARQFYRVLQLP